MSVDVLGYLTEKGLFPKRAPGDEFHVACMYCGEDQGKRGRLYVNCNPDAEIPGLHHCKLCDTHGSLVSIQKFYGDATEKQEREDTGYIRRAILATAATYYCDVLGDNLVALRWLTAERGLTIDTIERYQLGWADGGLFRHLRTAGFNIADIVATGLAYTQRDTGKMVDFLDGHVTIPYTVAGSVVMIRGRAFGDDVEKGKKYLTPTGQKTRLFNSDVTWDAQELIIAEGEFDCLVLCQMGYAAVACPGANVWQDAWTSYFTDVRRTWIVFDRDEREVGAKAAVKVQDKLGAKARIVELPPHDHGKSKNDITEYIVVCGHSHDDFELLLRSNRGLLITVAEAIAEHGSLQGQVGMKFGMRGLDLMINPGLLATQLMIVLATSGTGKTILMLNLFHRICAVQPDFKILFLSLEQTRGDWWERARRMYRFFNPGSTDADAEKYWSERIWLVDRNRVTPEQFLTILEDFTAEVGRKPDLVGVDYLGYWAQGFKGERYERTSDAVMSLKEILKDQRLRGIAPHQVNRSVLAGSAPGADSARDSGVILETADFLFGLSSEDLMHERARDQRSGEYKLAIRKSRHGGVGSQYTLQFAPSSLTFSLADEPERVQWAHNEIYYQNFYPEESWEQAQMRHQAGTVVTVDDFTRVEQALWKKRQGVLR